MAIYELWIERFPDGKCMGHYNRVPPEKGNATFATASLSSPQAAAQAIRDEIRRVRTATDQFRVRDRTNVYDNINEALEDMMRY